MPSRSLGVLTLDMVAKVGGFVEGMSKADRETERRMRNIRRAVDRTVRNVRRLTRVATVSVAAGTAITGALVNSARQAIDEQAKLARTLETTVEGLQVATRAGELQGVAFDKVSQATKDLERRLSQAAAGGGPAVEILERLNLTAQELQALPLDERLELINQRILDFIPAAERAAAAGQLFGEEGGQAVERIDPATIAAARAEIERFGLALSDVDAAKVEEANDAISRLSLIRQGAFQRLTVELAPFLTAISESIADQIEELGGLDDVVAEVFDNIVRGSINVAAAVRQPVRAIQTVVNDLWAGFQALPPWVQEIGLVGAIIGGARGRVALLAIAALGDDIAESVDRIQNAATGGGNFVDLLFEPSGDFGEKVLNDLRFIEDFFRGRKGLPPFIDPPDQQQVAAAVQETVDAAQDAANQSAGDFSIIRTLFGDPDGPDGEQYRQDLLNWWDNIQADAERRARESAAAREEAGGNVGLGGIDFRQREADEARLQGLLEKHRQVLTGVTDAQATYNETIAEFADLRAAQLISQEQYNAGLFGAYAELADQTTAKTEDTVERVSTLWEEASKQIQGHLAEFLFDPFDEGLEGMVQGFADAIRRIAAERAAEQAFDWLSNLGQNAGDGTFGNILRGIGDFFGGGKAFGGAVSAGRVYPITERGMPEIFATGGRQFMIPAVAGNVTPVAASAGGTNNFNYYITTPNYESFRRSERQARRDTRRDLGI